MDKIKFPLDVNGYHFTSWKDAAEQLSYSEGSVIRSRYKRLKDTHTVEEIFVPKGHDSLFPLDVNGYHFTSWKDTAKQLGYTTSTFKYYYEQMKDTHTLEEIFVPRVEKETFFPLDINGYHFTSWKDAGLQLGYSSMNYRYHQMKDTHTLEEIFVPKGHDSLFPLDVNGYHFVSWMDASKQLGYVSINARYNKMKDTHTLEEIFVPKVVIVDIFPLDVNGYHFKNWSDASRQLGYDYVGSMQERYYRKKDTHTLEEIFVPKGHDSFFPLDVNGYHFTSWVDASKQLNYYAFGASLKNRYDTMKDTHTLEEIFVPKGHDSFFPLDVNGYHFTSWKDAGLQLGYSEGGINNRYKRMLKNGYTLEDIFVPFGHGSLFPLDVNGYHFTSWKDVSDKLGYATDTIQKYYNSKKDTHSLEEIFIPNDREYLFPLDVNGYHFKNWRDASKQLGYHSIVSRYNRMKDTHSLEEIFVPKPIKTIFPLDVNGYHFISWADASEQLGYLGNSSMHTRYTQMKDTHTLEEIFVPKVEKETIFPLDVNGYYFTSWSDAARQLGYTCTKSYEVLQSNYNRMKDTHSLEEIFVPKVEKEAIFPLDVNGYYFTSWSDAAEQLEYSKSGIKGRYRKMKDTHSLEEIFVPKVEKEYTTEIFPLDINGYHFTSWVNASLQLIGNKSGSKRLLHRFNTGYPLMEVFGFSLHILEHDGTKINEYLTCNFKISDNLYKCTNKKTGLFELHTYDELNDMWRKFKGIKIVKE